MTARKLHETNGDSDCKGCSSTAKNETCEIAICSKCPHTYKPIARKSKRRVCMDFSKSDCGACCDSFYERIRVIEVKNANPPDCPPSGGSIRISNESMDRNTGLFCFSVDAYDAALQPHERFKITAWARSPNSDEFSISAYIGIDV